MTTEGPVNEIAFLEQAGAEVDGEVAEEVVRGPARHRLHNLHEPGLAAEAVDRLDDAVDMS